MRLELTAEQATFRASVERFVRDEVYPQAAAIDASGTFPLSLVRRAGTLGLMGVTLPKRVGGSGCDYVSYALAVEAVARASATLAVILAVNNSLVAEVIGRFGTDVQQQRWLGGLATGRAIGSFALSERDAGTDAGNQKTVAVVREDGYRLRGSKVWVANAEHADIVIVFAATTPGIGGRGVTAFLVPMTAKGLGYTARADSLGVRGLGCLDLTFDDVLVGPDARLGGVGQGFRIAMWALDGGRIAIAAQAVGLGRAAFDEAQAHARRRHAFGRPIGRNQAIQWMLADIATELDAASLLTLKAAVAKHTRDRCSLEASMAKLFASEAAHRAADKAMQILASAGYRRGSLAERLFRDARATEIYQGTSEVQRMVIASQVLSGS